MTQRYTASRLPKQFGPAAWNAILGQRTPNPILEDNLTADFVVIGAGFAGLSAARRLRQLQPTASIVLLDAGEIAEGGAGRNSGFMIDLPHELTSEDYAGAGDDKTLIQLNRKAISFASQAVEEYCIDPNYFDPVGKVNGAASQRADDHNTSYQKHLASLGEKSQRLDQQDMYDLTGSRHYLSGLYSPGTVMLQPAGYIRGLADGLKAQDVTIYENSPVTSFEKQPGGSYLVKTSKGSISTGKVILTVNGHLESFGIEKGRLMQLFLYAVMTPELDEDALKKLGGKPRWGITPSDPMGTTMRRINTGQGGNRIVTRTCASLKPNLDISKSDMARTASTMQRKFNQRFPQLAGIKMEYHWAGHLCLSLNNVSVMRQIDDNVYAGCVQNGLGTARGTLTGIGAAELACGDESDIAAFFNQETAPKKLPPQPFQQIGANLVLRYKEWVARDE
ncbi:NAD(P)/FAD-dependent oxidoreductase [Curvivirga aplysinae]|uniref:NAD(P)/FAD-dependent oxidoreductase n=1 Tax=Curvivirga aplysinae TaxID=2529852 RepID=UPI0012BBC817|nr:FAD-binding oxidoreductase [Curvivirga aplysinae]MTI09738.1 FAD-binding oxidoreductase [Curvivirga aplysinae]